MSTGTPFRLPLWSCCVGGLLLLLLAALGLLMPYDPGRDTELLRRFWSPGWGPDGSFTLLGRDAFGRDLARMLGQGVLAWLGPGVLAALLAGGVGLALAWAEPEDLRGLPGEATVVMALQTLPPLAWLMLLAVATQQNVWSFGVGVGVLEAPGIAQRLRQRFRQLRQREVIAGAHGHGLSPAYVQREYRMRLEGLPELARALPELVAQVLLLETALSYLGELGAPEQSASWGRMLKDLSPLLFRAEPGAALWVALLPLGALMLSLLILYGLGEGVAEQLPGGSQARRAKKVQPSHGTAQVETVSITGGSRVFTS